MCWKASPAFGCCRLSHPKWWPAARQHWRRIWRLSRRNCCSAWVSLVHLWEEDGDFLFERQERQERSASADVQGEDWVRCRYLGAAFQLQDRLFLMDYEPLPVSAMSQTILIPSYKSRITRLNGLKPGVSSGDRRSPA